MTDAGKREPFIAHTPLFVSFQGLWEGRGEPRGLEVGDCVLEMGCLLGGKWGCLILAWSGKGGGHLNEYLGGGLGE